MTPIPVIKTLFWTIVLQVFVMARRECCRETETAIFAARINLPVLAFQTWQVWCSAPGNTLCYMLSEYSSYIKEYPIWLMPEVSIYVWHGENTFVYVIG